MIQEGVIRPTIFAKIIQCKLPFYLLTLYRCFSAFALRAKYSSRELTGLNHYYYFFIFIFFFLSSRPKKKKGDYEKRFVWEIKGWTEFYIYSERQHQGLHLRGSQLPLVRCKNPFISQVWCAAEANSVSHRAAKPGQNKSCLEYATAESPH